MFDISFIGSFIAGVLSFLSPCILPIVPFYLSYLAGVGMSQITSESALPPGLQMRAVLAALCFSAGVITIFMGLGATATAFGQMVREYFDILRWLAAAIIIVMGLHFLQIIRIGILYREFRTETNTAQNISLVGAYVIGLAFAFGWTPCVGPVLAAILFTAAGAETSTHGASLLLTYGIGMTLPFILAALFIGPFMRWMSKFRRYLGRVEQAMGALLVVFGILIATNSVNYIANWMIEMVPSFTSLG